MDEIRLFSVLELDSIYRVISWEERIKIHLYLRGKKVALTDKILKVECWIRQNNWEAPIINYNQDRVFRYYNEELNCWRNLEDYPRDYEELTEEIKNIKL